VVVRDGRLPSDIPPKLVAAEGPASVTYQRINPSSVSSLTPTFNIDVPSQLTGLSRQLYWEAAGTFTITGTNLDTLTTAERVAMRAFPLQSITSSMSAQVNNTTVNLPSPAEHIAAILRVSNTTAAAANLQSTGPASPDWASEYDDLVGTLASPFRRGNDTVVSNWAAAPRTANFTSYAVNGAGTEVTISFRTAEPLLLSPFQYTGATKEKAIYGLNKVTISPVLSNVHRALSIALGATATISNVTLALNDQALIAAFITPDARSMAMARESARAFRYHYAEMQPYISTLGGTLNPGDSTTGSSNSFQLSTIPHKLVIYATYSETDRQDPSLSLADAFMPISSCQISAGVRSGILSGAGPVQLWAISNKNGVNTPYWNWNGQPMNSSSGAVVSSGSGGPLILDVAQDLNLEEGLTPGMNVQFQVSVSSITVTNRFKRNVVDPKLVVLAITDGVLVNLGGATMRELGGIPGTDSDEFRNASVIDSTVFHAEANEGGYGGSKVGKFFKSLWHTTKKLAPLFGPEASLAVQGAEAAGAGRGGGMLGGAMLGGGSLGGRMHPMFGLLSEQKRRGAPPKGQHYNIKRM